MSNITKIGIIGFGKRGKTHLRNYIGIKEAKVIAICDLKKPEPAGQKIGYFKDYKKMLESECIDAVSLCLPNFLHYKITRNILDKGKHVLVEKPITIITKEAKDLAMISRGKNLVCMVGYNLRFDMKIQKIKSIINSGELGKILMVRARQSHNWGGKEPFDWLMDKSKSGGGTLIDNATHYLNLFEYLVGDISELQAFSNNLSFGKKVEDNALVALKFRNGAIGSIETSWQDASGRNNELVIWGSKAVLEYKDSNDKQIMQTKSYFQDNDEWNRMKIEKIYLPKGIEQISKTINLDNDRNLSAENTMNMLKYFLKLINDQEERNKYTKSNFPEKTVKIIEAVYKSIKSKKVINIH